MYAIGVDVGGTAVKIGIFTEDGELKTKWQIDTDTGESGEHILPDISDTILSRIAQLNIDKCDIAGIGMGVPGPVKDKSVVVRCVNLGWGVFDVAASLSKLTGMRVVVGNDANVAALGELWAGAGKGHKNAVMVTLGTGIGGGIIIDEKIVEGAFGAAGEIGHIPVRDDETRTCGCGKKGCFEQYASASGLANMAERYVQAHPNIKTTLKPGDDSKTVFEKADLGDEAALAVIDEACRCMGRTFAAISCVVDPEIFMIGGGMSKAGQTLVDSIGKYYREYAFHASRNTLIDLAKLGNDAGIYGGARLVLQTL